MLASVPGMTTPHVSIRYAKDLTVVAITEAGPAGVDVERYDAASFPGFDSVVAHEQEDGRDARSRSINWVRKESLLKATGHGLAVDPRLILLTSADETPSLVEWSADDPPSEPVWMSDVVITSAYVASVTVLSPDRPDVEVRRVDPAARP